MLDRINVALTGPVPGWIVLVLLYLIGHLGSRLEATRRDVEALQRDLEKEEA